MRRRTIYFKLEDPKTIYDFKTYSRECLSYLDFKNDDNFKPIMNNLETRFNEPFTVNENYLYLTGFERIILFTEPNEPPFIAVKAVVSYGEEGLVVDFTLLKHLPNVMNVVRRRRKLQEIFNWSGPWLPDSDLYFEKEKTFNEGFHDMKETIASIDAFDN